MKRFIYTFLLLSLFSTTSAEAEGTEAGTEASIDNKLSIPSFEENRRLQLTQFVKALKEAKLAKEAGNYEFAKSILEAQLPLVQGNARKALPLYYAELATLSKKTSNNLAEQNYQNLLIASIPAKAPGQESEVKIAQLKESVLPQATNTFAKGETLSNFAIPHAAYSQASSETISKAPPSMSNFDSRLSSVHTWANSEINGTLGALPQATLSRTSSEIFSSAPSKLRNLSGIEKTTEKSTAGVSITTPHTQSASTGIPDDSMPDSNFSRDLFTVSITKDGFLQKDAQDKLAAEKSIEKIINNMAKFERAWSKGPGKQDFNLVLFAHGGMNSEEDGLKLARAHVPWWLANHVYPIYFIWHTGPADMLQDVLGYKANPVIFLAGDTIQKGFFEAIAALLAPSDESIENYLSKLSVKEIWGSMKAKALSASAPIDAASANVPGASLVVSKLHKHIQSAPSTNYRIHLIGHSAGAIFCTGLLNAISHENDSVETMNLLAPAITFRDFYLHASNKIGKSLKSVNLFVLSDASELHDSSCSIKIAEMKIGYPHSLLYLVSRSFEIKNYDDVLQKDGSHALLGMAKHLDFQPVLSLTETPRSMVSAHGEIIECPGSTISKASEHGDFPDDTDTMDSVLKKIIGKTIVSSVSYLPGIKPRTEGIDALNFFKMFEFGTADEQKNGN